MNPAWLLASVLVLHPVVEEAGGLRLAAFGTGDAPVEWSVDGAVVAVTRDGEAVSVAVASGAPEVQARTEHDGPWEAHARPDPWPGEGAAYVSAWSAVHAPAPVPEGASTAGPSGTQLPPGLLLLLAAVGFALVLWPRHRPKHP